jgi:hypothetical protein
MPNAAAPRVKASIHLPQDPLRELLSHRYNRFPELLVHLIRPVADA